MPGTITGCHDLRGCSRLPALRPIPRFGSVITSILAPRAGMWRSFNSSSFPWTWTSIPLSTRIQSDSWAWQFEKNGIFTVRSAYRLFVKTKLEKEAWLEGRASSSDAEGDGRNWTKLWKVKVPSKIRVFLWRLAQHSLPTGDLLAHRHMADSATCAICGESDSWRHSLISCTLVRCVWALVDEQITEHMVGTVEPSAK